MNVCNLISLRILRFNVVKIFTYIALVYNALHYVSFDYTVCAGYCIITGCLASMRPWLYRVFQKTDTQFYFWDNFGNSAPILTILSLLQAEIYGA